MTKSFLPEVNLFQAVINPSWFFPHVCNPLPTRSPNRSRTSPPAPSTNWPQPSSPNAGTHSQTPSSGLSGWTSLRQSGSPKSHAAETPSQARQGCQMQPPARTATEHGDTSPILLRPPSQAQQGCQTQPPARTATEHGDTSPLPLRPPSQARQGCQTQPPAGTAMEHGDTSPLLLRPPSQARQGCQMQPSHGAWGHQPAPPAPARHRHPWASPSSLLNPIPAHEHQKQELRTKQCNSDLSCFSLPPFFFFFF